MDYQGKGEAVLEIAPRHEDIRGVEVITQPWDEIGKGDFTNGLHYFTLEVKSKRKTKKKDAGMSILRPYSYLIA
jgi:hypothetical protein